MDSIATDTPHYHDFTPPFAIPSSWQWVRLGKISNYGECLNIPVDNISSEEWILELEDLEKGTATIIQVLSKKDRNIKGVRHKFDKGNVLYSKLRTYLNKVLVAPCDGYCTTEIIPFNSYGGISTDYLTYVLRSAYFVNYTQQCGYGVKMPRLSTSDACKGLIPLPPIAEQERIVMQIKLWSNLIDQMDCNKNNLQNEIVQVKYKILELAVTGKLVPQNPDDEPAAELLKRINPDAEIVTDNGHYPQLPEGWCVCRLEDIVDFEQPQKYIVSSTDYSNDYYTPVLTAGKSFIIGYTDETFGVYNTLPVIIFDDFTTESKFVDFAFKVKSSAMKILTVKKPIITQFIHAFMRITHLIGDTHKRYWISEYSKLHIMLPPLEEQERIVQTVMSFESTLEDIKSLLESD